MSANLAATYEFTYLTMVGFEIHGLVYHIQSKGKGKESQEKFFPETKEILGRDD